MYVNPTRHTDAQMLPQLSDVYATLKLRAVEKRDSLGQIAKRQYGYGGYGYNYGYSGWSGYGRWIVLGVVVGLAVLIYLLVCCCNRKRTRSGQKPVKYTGWATPYQHPQQSGVVPNDHGNNYAHQQPYVAPQMQQQQSYPQTETYPQTQNYGDNNYAAGGYQSTQPPITNAAGYDANNPPSYPYQQPTYPNNVAGREK